MSCQPSCSIFCRMISPTCGEGAQVRADYTVVDSVNFCCPCLAVPFTHHQLSNTVARLAPRRHATLPICLPLPVATACMLVLLHAEVLEARLVLPICALGSGSRGRHSRSICMRRPTAGALP